MMLIEHVWYGYRQKSDYRQGFYMLWWICLFLIWIPCIVMRVKFFPTVLILMTIMTVFLVYGYGFYNLFSSSPAFVITGECIMVMDHHRKIVHQFDLDDIDILVCHKRELATMTVIFKNKKRVRLELPRLNYEQLIEIQTTFAQIRPQTQQQPEKNNPHNKAVLAEQNIQQILQNQQANFATPYKLDFEHVWQDNRYITITDRLVMLVCNIIFFFLGLKINAFCAFLGVLLSFYLVHRFMPKEKIPLAKMDKAGLSLYSLYDEPPLFIAWQDLRKITIRGSEKSKCWFCIEKTDGKETEWDIKGWSYPLTEDIRQSVSDVIKHRVPKPKF